MTTVKIARWSRALLCQILLVLVFFICFHYGQKATRRREEEAQLLGDPKWLHSQATTSYYSGDLCVIYNFTRALGLRNLSLSHLPAANFAYEPISLCTHSTLDWAHHLWEHVTHWDDFISYALFIRGGEEDCMAYFIKAWCCHPILRGRVSLHLVWRRDIFQEDCQPSSDILAKFTTAMLPSGTNGGKDDECSDFRKNYSQLACASTTPDLHYPYNRLNNIVRIGAATQLHLVADIDTSFSAQFAIKVRAQTRQHLMPWLDPTASNTSLAGAEGRQNQTHAPRTVLVYRRFETELARPPRTVEALYALVKDNRASFFNSHYFPNGHFIPGESEWFEHALTNPNNATIISMPLSYTRFPGQTPKNTDFEPQFIAHASTPLYYESIVGRHMLRQVMANELCRAGYEFRLLSHVFNVHTGIKREATPLEKLLLELNSDERGLFSERYNSYLDEKYPKMNETCPEIG